MLALVIRAGSGSLDGDAAQDCFIKESATHNVPVLAHIIERMVR